MDTRGLILKYIQQAAAGPKLCHSGPGSADYTCSVHTHTHFWHNSHTQTPRLTSSSSSLLNSLFIVLYRSKISVQVWSLQTHAHINNEYALYGHWAQQVNQRNCDWYECVSDRIFSDLIKRSRTLLTVLAALTMGLCGSLNVRALCSM